MSTPRGFCCFTLDDRALALDVELVTEVVNVDTILPVPRSPSFVLGLFSLRGSPVVIVDLSDILGFGPSKVKQSPMVLVMKKDELLVAFPIDRMEDVLRPERGTITPAAENEHPAVSCFFQAPDSLLDQTITVLDSSHLLQCLRAKGAPR